MKNSYRILMVCTLLLSMVFTAVGYAQVTDSLSVNGSVGVKGWDIYISNIGTALSSGGASCTVNGYTNTPFLSTKVALPRWIFGTSPSVTIPVTIKNDTDKTVQYIGILKATHDNANIQVNVSAAASATDLTIAPNGSTTVNVTFSYVNKTGWESTLNSYFKFNFLPQDDLMPPSNYTNDPVSVFEEILRDQTKFDALYQAMLQQDHAGDAAHQKRAYTSFIGWVPGGAEADNNLIDLLFGSNREKLRIGGTNENPEEVDVQGLIIATNQDSKNISEASTVYLYVITDTGLPANKPNTNGNYETYVAAFNRNVNGGWEQATLKEGTGITENKICRMVKGEANAVPYAGNGDGGPSNLINSVWSNTFKVTAGGRTYWVDPNYNIDDEPQDQIFNRTATN